jgi:tRNA(Ile)-lysidine synthase
MGRSTPSQVKPALGLGLAERFEAHTRTSGLLPRGAAVTVALSGGLDSVVLLDLLCRLQSGWNWSISAAHFDHRMRETSGREAERVGELSESLAVPYVVGRSPTVPRNEAEAREQRYAFLLEACVELCSDTLATAHQADDQAETVLFRLVRGSGLGGLAGIPARRPPCVVRPLLPFWRVDLEGYAAERELDFLTDSSNRDLSIARNLLRQRLIPDIEASVAPDFRLQLQRLGGLAARATRAVEGAVGTAAAALVEEVSESRIVVARTGFLAYDTHVRAHLLRALAARVGPRPSRVGTRTALEFINTCSSGRRLELAGGITISREFDRLILERRSSDLRRRDEELVISDLRGGDGHASIGGACWRVRWVLGARDDHTAPGEQIACFDPSALQLPLTVRGWRPGDKIRLAAGTRKLKKVFVDRKVGRSERASRPLLADEAGVLWVVGLARGVRATDDESQALCVHMRREE